MQQQSSPTAFLAGSRGPASTWRQDIAIPMLEARNVVYYDPTDPRHSEQETEQAKATARYLVYVIDDHTRGLEEIREATQAIMAGERNVMLAIEYLPYDVIIDGQRLDDHEVQSLNQARRTLWHLNETIQNTKVGRMDTIVELMQLLIIFAHSHWSRATM